jgi:hypothetical protein
MGELRSWLLQLLTHAVHKVVHLWWPISGGRQRWRSGAVFVSVVLLMSRKAK